MVLHKNFLTSVNSMPPKRRATSYATRAATRRRVAEHNPYPSHLTVHPAAGEVQQGTIGMNQPPAQVGRWKTCEKTSQLPCKRVCRMLESV